MRIHSDFTGGNICVKQINNDTVYLENQLRDTTEDWFYWAFCVEGAGNKQLTFHFQPNRLGYFGPAVSYDLKNWHWLDKVNDDCFTYTFSADESKVYFAHSMLYHPDRFYDFAKEHSICITELCKSKKGRSVPCVKLGNGDKSIILTARHHACESTGSYVLEGVLSELLKSELMTDYTVFCVPFVDFDGVIDGDQGKSRRPYDHNRDYNPEMASIYPETAAIREYADENGCVFGFDFHSPWHRGRENDTVFIVQNCFEKLDSLNRFGETLENSITDDSLKYEHKNDYPFGTGWNKGGNQFAAYMTKKPENDVAFTLETAYFGSENNKVNEQRLLSLGKCFANALKEYIS
ncbi:MAG: hypothetical protein IJF54_07210 [Clostridia bacterium]|nr:hypothetical protein [Clostridia bacterium]